MNASLRGVSTIALACLLTLLAQAPATAAEAQSWEVDPGTTVVLVEDHRVPLVTVAFEFPAGTWSPWAWDNHAEEAFEIQLYDPQGELRARADRLAAALALWTGTHASQIQAGCRREDLDQTLELLRDVLANRDFDERELRRWKQSQGIEWSASLKEPEFRLEMAAASLLFQAGDPRRRPYEKPRPYVTQAARLLTVRDTIVRLPGRVIAFAGDIDRETASRLAAGLLPPVLDDPPAGLEATVLPVVRSQDAPREQTVRMSRIAQIFFGYGRESLTYADERYPAFLIADHVLGGHFYSRLYQALRHEGGETYGAYTTGEGGPYSDAYALATFTRAENGEPTEAKLREVLRRLHDEGITEEERASAIGYLFGRRPFSRQSPAQILDRFLWERRHGLPPAFRDALEDRASRLTLDEINTFIRDFYDPSHYTMLRVAPQ